MIPVAPLWLGSRLPSLVLVIGLINASHLDRDPGIRSITRTRDGSREPITDQNGNPSSKRNIFPKLNLTRGKIPRGNHLDIQETAPVSDPQNLLFTINLFGYTLPITTWTLFGLVGNVLFTARVLVQWVASERAGRSVTPVAFWWLSLAAAVIMITYAFGRREIPFILGLGVTLAPYTRNLVIHYRPGRPPRPLGIILTAAVMLACVPVLIFWKKAAEFDGWFYFGLVATSVFYSRFFVQWVHGESTRTTQLPLAFWILSLVGSVMLLAYSIVREDAPFILGFLFNAIPYARNIILIRRPTAPVSDAAASAQTREDRT